MKRKVSRAMILAGIILFFLVVFTYAYWNGETEQDTTKVSVVLEAQNTVQWEVLRQGMESFAAEKGIELRYVMLTGNETVKERLEILHREVQNGAEGLVLNLANQGLLVEQMNDSLSQVKLVMVDSFLPLVFEAGYVAADNKAMGRRLGEAAAAKAAPGEVFGVIMGNINRESNKERLEGVRESLDGRIAFTASETAGISKELWSQADRILCLDAQAGEETLERAEEDGKLLYTIGRTEKLVYYLDKGLVDVMVAADEFVMGYSALENLYWQLRYYGEAKGREIPFILVDKSNLYGEKVEEIMFPSVQ